MTSLVAHVLVPAPSWRPASWPGVTGCARRADQVARALPRAEFDQGYRAAIRARNGGEGAYCASCYWTVPELAIRSGQARSESLWTEDPVAVIALDAKPAQDRTGRRDQLAAELRALAALAAKHPDEFARLLEAEQVLAALGGPR